MKYLREKSKKNSFLFKKNELNYLIFKSFLNFFDINKKDKLKFCSNFWFLKLKKHSFVKIKNRCLLTNSSSSVTNRYRMHRMALRLSISNGYLNGLKKSSW